jgi:hypothetical protein
MPDLEREAADASEPSWFTRHQSLIVSGLVLPLVVALLTWGATQVWDHFHTPSAEPRISDFRTTDQTPFQQATVTVRVHNDGKTSIDGCVIHWFIQAPLGRGPQERGASREFGLNPGESQSVTFYGPEVSPTKLLLIPAGTWAYVQCGNVRSPDSAHRRVVMSGLI